MVLGISQVRWWQRVPSPLWMLSSNGTLQLPSVAADITDTLRLCDTLPSPAPACQFLKHILVQPVSAQIIDQLFDSVCPARFIVVLRAFPFFLIP